MILTSSLKVTAPSYYTYIYYCVFICCSFTLTQAQSIQQDTILAAQYYQKADSLLTEVKTDSSIIYFKKALPLYEKAKVWKKVVSCYNNISLNYYRNKNADLLLVNAEKALEICKNYLPKNHPEEATAYESKGTYHRLKSDYINARMYYKKALDQRLKKHPKNQEQIVQCHNDIAYTYYKESNFQEATKKYQESLTIGKLYLKNNHKKILNIYKMLGNIEHYLGNYDNSLNYRTKNLQLTSNKFGESHIKTGDTHNSIAVAFLRKKNHNMALHHLNKALSIYLKNGKEDYSKTAMVYHNKARILKDQTKYNQALEHYNKSLKIHIKTSGENSKLTAETYESIGGIYSLKKELNKASQYYKKSLEIKKNVLNENDFSIALSYNNLGVLYKNKKMYEESILYYESALNILKKVFEKNHHYFGRVYSNIAIVYTQKKEYDLAFDYLEQAEKIAIISLGKENSALAHIYQNMGVIMMKKNLTNKSLKYFNKSLNIKQHSSNKTNISTIVETLNNIGQVYLDTKEYKNSLNYLKKAIETNSKKAIKDTIFNPDNFFDINLLLDSLNKEAKALIELYKENNSIEHLNNNIESYRKADIVINHIQKSIQKHEDKIAFIEKTKETYTNAIQAQLFKRNISKEEKVKQTFYYSERSKATILDNFLKDLDSKSFSNMPSNLLELDKKLRVDRAFYKSKLINSGTTKEVDSIEINYKNKLFQVEKSQDSLSLVLEKEYPKYHELKYKNTIVTLEAVQQKLNSNQSLLEFFTSDSTTYAFVITKNDLKVTELTTPELSNKIEQYQHAIVSQNTTTYKKLAHPLYQELIHPIKDQLAGDELIIVPDGPLWHLNFDLLLTEQSSTNNPKEFPYLLNQYAISYANSANLLFNTFKTKQIEKTNECLAFSFTDSTNISTGKNMSLATLRDTDADLPGTREEIKAIADIIDGQYYFGSEAIEQNFKKDASRYNILHLALHGEVDHEHPEKSKLYFTKSKDTLEDNVLYSHELFALDIPAELTVLSACNTGSGKIAQGEGIMSLGTAFQYAGSKSLLLTSWEVSDQTTPELMKLFYTHLKNGMNKSKALQRAKLDFLKTADLQRIAPFYWGGFYLVGDTTPIAFKSDLLWLKIIGSILLITVLIFFLIRYKKKRL